MPIPTPETLPETGRVFSITMPDSVEWSGILLGCLVEMLRSGYWIETEGGLTVEETIEAITDVLWPLNHGEGVPE